MIIQCELCSTRFKLDDTKLKEEGVRVRCSKCRHIFVVRKEKPETVDDTDFDTLLNGLVSTSPQEPDPFPGAYSFGSTETGNQDSSGISETASFEGFDTDINQVGLPDTHEKKTQNDYESADSDEKVQPYCEEQTDLGDFSKKALEERSLHPGGDTTGSELAISSENNEVDFSFAFTSDSTVSPDVDERPDEVAITNGAEIPVSDELTKEKEPYFTSGISWDAPFPVISGGNETLSPVQSNGQDTDSFNGNNVDEQVSQVTTAPDISADEIPPAVIASRRLGRSRLPFVVVLVSVLIIIILTGSGFYLLNKGPEFINKSGIGSLVKWAGIDKSNDGGISIRNTSSEFIDNKEAGELFIIKGEAVNLFKKPRASIQLKATIYDSKGGVLVSRNVYCGNVLQKDQLTILPMSKIDAAMGNQFGDSLSNLGVSPEKAIPFVVVFPKVPKAASEFGLEIVGSTVADR
jgi:predicted Zn finger-like uncharacterized protein